jgi:hypothetical protein
VLQRQQVGDQKEMVKGQPDVSILLQARMGGVGSVDEVGVRRTGIDRRKEEKDVRLLVGAIRDGDIEEMTGVVVVDGNGKMKVQQQAGVVGNVQQQTRVVLKIWGDVLLF